MKRYLIHIIVLSLFWQSCQPKRSVFFPQCIQDTLCGYVSNISEKENYSSKPLIMNIYIQKNDLDTLIHFYPLFDFLSWLPPESSMTTSNEYIPLPLYLGHCLQYGIICAVYCDSVLVRDNAVINSAILTREKPTFQKNSIPLEDDFGILHPSKRVYSFHAPNVLIPVEIQIGSIEYSYNSD